MQKIFYFIDDSGVFHENEKVFIYAGYIFVDKESKDTAKRKYKTLLKEIQKDSGNYGEIKAFGLKNKHKRALFNVMQEYYSFSVKVDIHRVYDYVMKSKHSRNRYKDYVLKRAIKNSLEKLISMGEVDPYNLGSIIIHIDQQGTASDGYYFFNESVEEELNHGISNFNYGTQFPPIIYSNCKIRTLYCDSSNNYLIQAADILANRVRRGYVDNNKRLIQIGKHNHLLLP